MIPKTLKQGEKVLALLQEKFPEYHPLIGVAKIAHSTDDERLEFDCHRTLCEYVEPKLKSVEVTQTLPEDAELRVVFEGEFQEIPPPGTSAPAIQRLPVEDILNEGFLEIDLEPAMKSA